MAIDSNRLFGKLFLRLCFRIVVVSRCVNFSRLTLMVVVTISALTASAQNSKSDLFGTWISENNDSLFYTSKYVTLYNDSTFIDRSNHCNFVEWTIQPEQLLESTRNKCVDNVQSNFTMSLWKQNLMFKRVGRRRTIELVGGNEVYARFRIIRFRVTRTDDKAGVIKVLKLKRI